MSKKKCRFISIILSVIMVLSLIPCSIITYNASMADEAEECEFGVEYSRVVRNGDVYYKFNLDKKMHISINYSYSKSGKFFEIYSASGAVIWNKEDIQSDENYNPTTEYYKGIKGKNLNAGTYYLHIGGYNYRDTKYSIIIDAENTIKLPKGKITSLKSPKSSQFTAKCSKASDAIGYQFQYSLTERFNGKTKSVKSPSPSKTVKKLKKGYRYYVRVRPYTIYTDGTYVFGQYSLPKSVKVK